MNECLTTPQHENQIGYWVSEKGKCMKCIIIMIMIITIIIIIIIINYYYYYEWMNEWMNV